MKVGTDGTLLGIEAGTFPAKRVLDVGTGCGIIALLIAQQTDAIIDAIDIDSESCTEASENFSLSPWSNRLQSIVSDFNQFSQKSELKYDLIVSNPPFFSTGKRKKEVRSSRARHDDCLSFDELAQGVSLCLEEDGNFIVIVPVHRLSEFQSAALRAGLYLSCMKLIRPLETTVPNRYIAVFRNNESETIDLSYLTIRNSDLTYTEDFMLYGREFFLNFPE